MSTRYTQFIKGEAHHGWLSSSMTVILNLHNAQVPLSGKSSKSLPVRRHQQVTIKYKNVLTCTGTQIQVQIQILEPCTPPYAKEVCALYRLASKLGGLLGFDRNDFSTACILFM